MNLRNGAVSVVRKLLHRMGFDLVRSLPDDDLLRRRLQLIRAHDINVLFDVGANTGQYAQVMRSLGYRGRIVSFEPLEDAFASLHRASERDGGWEAVKAAVGELEGEGVIHVAANSQSSSLAKVLAPHLAADPRSETVGVQPVIVTRLDREIRARVGDRDRLFVKIDTQGYENQVLAGAGDETDRIVGLQVELSLVPLYEGQPLMGAMLGTLERHGFRLMSLEPGFWSRETGQLLQVDGVFFRHE